MASMSTVNRSFGGRWANAETIVSTSGYVKYVVPPYGPIRTSDVSVFENGWMHRRTESAERKLLSSSRDSKSMGRICKMVWRSRWSSGFGMGWEWEKPRGCNARCRRVPRYLLIKRARWDGSASPSKRIWILRVCRGKNWRASKQGDTSIGGKINASTRTNPREFRCVDPWRLMQRASFSSRPKTSPATRIEQYIFISDKVSSRMFGGNTEEIRCRGQRMHSFCKVLPNAGHPAVTRGISVRNESCWSQLIVYSVTLDKHLIDSMTERIIAAESFISLFRRSAFTPGNQRRCWRWSNRAVDVV